MKTTRLFPDNPLAIFFALLGAAALLGVLCAGAWWHIFTAAACFALATNREEGAL